MRSDEARICSNTLCIAKSRNEVRAQNFRKAPQFNCAVLPPKKEVNPMDIQINDILTMKKQHPCGSKQWQVLRIGMDFKLKCLGCGHEVMLPRSKAEKNIRTVEREGEIVC